MRTHHALDCVCRNAYDNRSLEQRKVRTFNRYPTILPGQIALELAVSKRHFLVRQRLGFVSMNKLILLNCEG